MPRINTNGFDDDASASARRVRMLAIDPLDHWWRVRLAETWPGPVTFAVARRWALSEVRRAYAELDELAPGWRDLP
jgi:hypothetical protein